MMFRIVVGLASIDRLRGQNKLANGIALNFFVASVIG
jgi:hypothetical protein